MSIKLCKITYYDYFVLLITCKTLITISNYTTSAHSELRHASCAQRSERPTPIRLFQTISRLPEQEVAPVASLCSAQESIFCFRTDREGEKEKKKRRKFEKKTA
ncbi:hypothetical protein CEXT_94381 [Caerostris extrusa]|uniref:Secreted protein n=1 Tax=Caerostris extrusa TaxID=172846 RepID=A0AAV4XZ28_CAEEX|nr:hypothetical protein CEXT_94381 [Caerostris extrusa]